ncbi:MAG: type ISP restriction/modification enzyme [Thiotrichaceae bacterium]
MIAHLVKRTQLLYQPERIVKSCYRPFVNKFLYYDKVIVHRTYQQTNIFPIENNPNSNFENLAIAISGTPPAKPFQVLAISICLVAVT